VSLRRNRRIPGHDGLEYLEIEVFVDDVFLAMSPADVELGLASRIRTARKARGWTQAELARRSALSLATITRIEGTGQGQISSLTRICAALGRLNDFEPFLKAAGPATLDELRRSR
jgi:DNA-binding XRE family transcriptional regulator